MILSHNLHVETLRGGGTLTRDDAYDGVDITKVLSEVFSISDVQDSLLTTLVS